MGLAICVYFAPKLWLAFYVRSPEYYAERLSDREFLWYGPESRAIRIPVLHAARALSYIGDPAVPFLLDAIDNPELDINSISDALGDIGLPSYKYRAELEGRDSSGLRKWWADYGEISKEARSKMRQQCGLPAL